VIFGAGGPGKSDSSAAKLGTGPQPGVPNSDPELPNSELRTGATPDRFAGSRGLLHRVKGLIVKDFISCYEESKPEQPSLHQGTGPGILPPCPISPGSNWVEKKIKMPTWRELDSAQG